LGIPWTQKIRIGSYLTRQLAAGRWKFPLVLMLEPAFRCNLQCPGCGKIDFPSEVLDRRLSVEECLSAAEECGAPVVSIAGGEPLLHPDMPGIVRGLTQEGRFVYLCTNTLLVEKRIDEFTPSPRLTFNVHLDGLGPRHDSLVGREGVFDGAVKAIRLLLGRGFRVTTNTTVFSGDKAENIARLFDLIFGLGVEGLTVSPGFGYQSASGQGCFLSRREAGQLFHQLFVLGAGRWQFNHSSLYLEFLAGHRDYRCSPWATPTRNIFGWQRPCYLLNDGHAASFRALVDDTDWERCGPGRDPRCVDCLMHCGFEPTAVTDAIRHPFEAMGAALRLRRGVFGGEKTEAIGSKAEFSG